MLQFKYQGKKYRAYLKTFCVVEIEREDDFDRRCVRVVDVRNPGPGSSGLVECLLDRMLINYIGLTMNYDAGEIDMDYIAGEAYRRDNLKNRIHYRQSYQNVEGFNED